MPRFLQTFNFGRLALLLAMLSGVAISQTQLGQISGSIVDPAGALIAGAKVTVTNVATGTREVTDTNNEGLFTVANVSLGDYEVAVEKEGFRRSVKRLRVEIAQRVNLTVALEVGTSSETVEVSGNAVVVNTVSGEISREVTSSEIQNMPLLTRNVYALLTLAPGSVNTSVSNGDDSGTNTFGIAVSGTRGRSIDYLLDGSENNETFATGPSTIVPVDAVQEFKVQSNSMTAEFGRNALLANVVTKSGTNRLHGSASEFYRGAALSSQPVEEKVNDIPKGNYVRNVFGASLGGPIIKNKTFFFGAFEGTRVRSVGRNFYYVPTTNFLNASSANMQSYLAAGGGIPAPLLPQVITAGDIVAFETAQSISTAPALLDSTGAPIPAATPLFQRTFTSVPIDAGGGVSQNTWSATGRVDHTFSDKTSLSGRYAWYRQVLPVGASSDSPFPAFDTDQSFRSQNGTLSLTHTFSPVLFNDTRIAYSRTDPQQPLGKGSVNVMCLQYGELTSLGTKDPMVFPGYVPANCQALALPSGGPQNTYSGYTSFSYVKGRNTFKWGGYGRHLRDNHTFGASENAAADSIAMQSLLNGVIDDVLSVAIDPRGHVPVSTTCAANPAGCYDPAVDGAIKAPSFTRHYHYNESALYFEDQIKVTSRLSLTAGLRYEYFGVLHSPNGERFLDANLYLDAVQSPAALSGKNLFAQIRDARFSRTNNFFNQNWTNFAPRIGFAWDATGNQRTVLRAGYGIFYDANFGNALFNAIQNPPNYAVLTEINGLNSGPGLVQGNQYDSLTSMVGTGAFRISSSARMLNRDMHTAYTQQWNATVEQDVGKGLFASLGYVGSKGDKLYSLNNLNPQGSCILLGLADCPGFNSRLNQSGLSRMNRRANEGFSRYHSLQAELKTREISHTGLQLATSYTWSHNIDNSTSFFNDSAFDFNGLFGFGNPFNPAGSIASSSNDIRHRFVANYTWEVPWTRGWSGVKGAVFGGWQLAGIYEVQTGAAFSVYEDQGAFGDLCESGSNGCYPVVTGALPAKQQERTFTGPNRSVLYDFSSSLTDLGTFCGGDNSIGGCIQRDRIFQPQGLFLPRNTFRTPGYWNFDASIMKNFKLPREGMSLQIRGEFFNIFNHSNLYADPNTNVLSSGQVLARRGVPPSHEIYGVVDDRRNVQLGAVIRF